MKNIIKHIYRNIVLLSILFLLAYSGYGQFQMATKNTQQNKLRNVAENIGRNLNLHFSVTIAMAQIPNTNTFYIASNRKEIPCAITVPLLAQQLTALGFSNYWNSQYFHFVYITGDVSTPTASSPNHSYTMERVGLPNKTVRMNINDPTTTLNVHAEMNLLAGLALKKPNFTKTQMENTIIVANRAYCHRCRAYLSSNQFYVGDLARVAQDESVILNSWCLPNYQSSNAYAINVVNWPNWLRQCSATYNTQAYSTTNPAILSRSGANMLDLIPGFSPVPQNPRWLENEDVDIVGPYCNEYLDD